MVKVFFQLQLGCTLLLLCCLQAVAGAKKSFVLPLHAKNIDNPAGMRRKLLRNATLPLHGAVKDYGYFYASLYLGTPPKKFAVIVDTGSTMTYVPCSTCGAACGPNHQDAAFDPHQSHTSRLIPCDSDKCRCGSPHCACSDSQQCMYTRSYAEQSSSSGVLLEDVVSLHDGGPGVPVIFGCETRETGEIFKQRADGLFGLGNSDASVVNQLVSAGAIDDVFSLCFGVVEGDGVLMLGDSPAAANIELQYTPLVPSPSHPFYYNIRLDAISVGDVKLDVPQSIFQDGYATVLDSGTTFTYIPTPAFQAFSAAVESYALQHGLMRVRGPDPQYDDVCFGGAPEHTDVQAMAAVFPSFSLHFASDAVIKLGPLNYLFVHTFNSGKYCLGVFDNGNAGTLLGGITFRNVLVKYDRRNSRVGFGGAACKELGLRHRPPCSMFIPAGSAGSDSSAVVAVADGDCEPDEINSSSINTNQYSYDDQEPTTTQVDDEIINDEFDDEHEVVMPQTTAQQQQPLDTNDGMMTTGNSNDEEIEEEVVGVMGDDDSFADFYGDDLDGDPSNHAGAVEFEDGDDVGRGGIDPEAHDDPAMIDSRGAGISSSGTQQQNSNNNNSGNSNDGNDGGLGNTPQDQDQDQDDESESIQYDDEDTNDENSVSDATLTHSTVAGHATPLTIGLLAGTVAMLSSALVVALFRPGPREAIRSIMPSFRRYEALNGNDDDPENPMGSNGKMSNGNDGNNKHSGSSSMTNDKSGSMMNSKNNTTMPMSIGNAMLNTTTTKLSSIPLITSKQAQPERSVAVIAMTDVSHHRDHGKSSSISSYYTGTSVVSESARAVGLTTPQKLQRTSSNLTAATSVLMAEEVATMQGHTPRSANNSNSNQLFQITNVGNAMPGGSRAPRGSVGPSTPTRMQLQ